VADRYEHYTAGVTEAALGELCTFLTHVFATPRQLPRRRVQQIDPDQELAAFRDELPHAIARRGTDAAFTTLAHLAAMRCTPFQRGRGAGDEQQDRGGQYGQDTRAGCVHSANR